MCVVLTKDIMQWK